MNPSTISPKFSPAGAIAKKSRYLVPYRVHMRRNFLKISKSLADSLLKMKMCVTAKSLTPPCHWQGKIRPLFEIVCFGQQAASLARIVKPPASMQAAYKPPISLLPSCKPHTSLQDLATRDL